MASTPMPCIICGGSTSLRDRGGTWVQQKGAFVRTRTCDSDPTHRFETREQPATEEILERSEVGEGEHTRPFELNVLRTDLDYTVGKVLPEGPLNAFTRLVSRQLVLPNSGPRDRPLPRNTIMQFTPQQISDTVAATLKAEGNNLGRKEPYRRAFRRAHLLYSFARGADGSAMPNAVSALDWLLENYKGKVDPAGESYRVKRHYYRIREDHWHPLRIDAAPEPTHVVFLKHVVGREPGKDGRSSPSMVHVRVPYDRDVLQSSIRHALAGSDDHFRVAGFVLQWVLWSLAGQQVVRQADLASQVTQCLRRVNEVAYLRWVTIVRDLDVEDVWQEALGLLAWPSPRLRFVPVAKHDPQTSDHVMPIQDAGEVSKLKPW